MPAESLKTVDPQTIGFDQVGLTKFQSRFLGDFYASFGVAQNDYELQFLTLIAITRSYTPDELVSPEHLNYLTPRIERMRMPQGHSKFRQNTMDPDIIPYIDEGAEHREFSRVWKAYQIIIGATHFGLPFDKLPGEYNLEILRADFELTDEDLYIKAAKRLIDRDVLYQIRTRHMISGKDELHRSVVKTHIIDGIPTHSPSINSFYIHLGRVITAAVAPEQRENPGYAELQLALGTFIAGWQAVYPGQNLGIL